MFLIQNIHNLAKCIVERQVQIWTLIIREHVRRKPGENLKNKTICTVITEILSLTLKKKKSLILRWFLF